MTVQLFEKLFLFSGMVRIGLELQCDSVKCVKTSSNNGWLKTEYCLNFTKAKIIPISIQDFGPSLCTILIG